MYAAAAAAKLLQLCQTLCDPIDGSPSGSTVPGILQARNWSGLPFPSPMHKSEKWKVKSLSRVQHLVTQCTAAYQGPPSMGFSRQEYWSGVPLPSPLFMYSWQKFVIYLKCRKWQLDIYTHCAMITTIKVIHPSPHIFATPPLFWRECWRIIFLANFKFTIIEYY